jgi:hypothetical protein
MGFTHLDPTGSVFLLQDATNCSFNNVGFRGTSATGDLTSDANGSIGVSFASTNALVCKQITFNQCVFSGLVWGVNTNQQTKAVVLSSGEFNTLYRGVVLGNGTTTNGGPTGTRIVGNVFDNIYAEGIIFGANLGLGINASGHNIFYDVGNHFTGSTGTPASSIINIESNNNVSISDLFERTDAYATTFPRILFNNTLSIGTTNGKSLTMGTYTRNSGRYYTLINNSSGTVFTLNTNVAVAFMIDYTIVRDLTYRTGTIMVATNGATPNLNYNDTNVENASTGITLTVTQTGTIVSFNYSATNTGVNGTISYAIRYLV